MKVHVASDLHLECYNPGAVERVVGNMLPPSGDILLLAGDVQYLHYYDVVKRNFLAIADRYNKIFFVPGNHEYWKRAPDEAESLLLHMEAEIQGFHWLRSGVVVEHKGKRFLGDTLWFPDDPLNAVLLRGWPDNELIRGFQPWVYERNRKFQEFLKKELKEGDVVLSHHAPSHHSVHPRFEGSVYNRFFVSEMSELIVEKKPALWVHGHMHNESDYVIGSTRIYANPFGYPSEHGKGTKKKFSGRLEIEV